MISTDTDECRLTAKNKELYLDVVRSLKETPKRLSSKYSYDKKSDSLFEAIMRSPDYYLTRPYCRAVIDPKLAMFAELSTVTDLYKDTVKQENNA